MKLKTQLAQDVVDNMMKQIPYNINMMNENGIIIASGDKSRIGQLHLGAKQVIKLGKTLPMKIYHGELGHPGVNMPIEYQHRIIGVIGITGSPDKVVPLASLLKVATELLVKQAAEQEKKDVAKSKLNRFLFRWIQRTDDLPTKLNLELEAQQLHIDLTKERYVIDFKASNELANKVKLGFSDFLLNRADDTQIIITENIDIINQYLALAKKRNIYIGVSQKTSNVAEAFRQARETVNWSTKLNIYCQKYEEVSFIDHIAGCDLDVDNIIDKLINIRHFEQGEDYLYSLLLYVRNSQILSKAADQLYIHRNTLAYRLERIKKITGLDPWKTEELFQLYIALIKMRNKS
ncbi:carbohydrate diacid regulator [Lactobacillus colini]|uniref:Carbohydrate diacid regulator n=1 Tax=Lactobacillus colini TaxID=1819254 RepID=A0ABS4MCT1_9LACO|nr:sugar diacid recognition domain-containing protein [Lactobacillus colini]MBP2057197.1 carbohydrate diacid regulator [Lactobacillus colini]